MGTTNTSAAPGSGLVRQMGVLGLAATGICSMLGAGINVIPFMIQRSVPGIGPFVLPAFLFAALPALLAAFAYAVLASAMPRAGGSYIYASRALNPYLGFVASFAQWFGLSIAIGVVSYVLIPFLRDIASALEFTGLAGLLDTGSVRLLLALIFLWAFVLVNLRGIQSYERTLIPLMFLMFALGAIVIVAGLSFNHADFSTAVGPVAQQALSATATPEFDLSTYFAAAAILFASFIGFDSIAQAGSEARNPGRTLPLAIAIAVITVGSFYFLFTAAVYHAVPWQYIAQESQQRDLTAPGLLGHLLSPGWTVAIVAGAAIALINDLPAMLLAVSRLMFAWAEDGIFPRQVARVHPTRHTPQRAIILSGAMASVGILGSHLAGDFFLGVDILVTSMLVNFLLMCLSVIWLPRRNPTLAAGITVVKSRKLQLPLAWAGVILLGGFLLIHLCKDITADISALYFHSTPVWLLVMAIASLIFWKEYRQLKSSGADVDRIFNSLPRE